MPLAEQQRNSTSSQAVDRSIAPALPSRPELDPFTDPIAVALIGLIAERGYDSFSELDIAEQAGVTVAEFHARFEDKLDCAKRSVESFKQDLIWRIESAYLAAADWRLGLRAASYAVADLLVAEPEWIRVIVVDLLRTKHEILRVLREETLMYGARLIDRGRSECPDPVSVPAGTATMAMGAAAQMLTHRMQEGGSHSPHEVVPQLLYLCVRRYVGEESAREELSAPRPAVGGSTIGLVAEAA